LSLPPLQPPPFLLLPLLVDCCLRRHCRCRHAVFFAAVTVAIAVDVVVIIAFPVIIAITAFS
jgi:hypothetical protein